MTVVYTLGTAPPQKSTTVQPPIQDLSVWYMRCCRPGFSLVVIHTSSRKISKQQAQGDFCLQRLYHDAP